MREMSGGWTMPKERCLPGRGKGVAVYLGELTLSSLAPLALPR